MYPSISKLKEILLQQHYISEADSKPAEAGARDGDDYVNRLISSGLLTKALLGQAMAEAYKLPFIDISVSLQSKEFAKVLNEKLARQYRLTVVKSLPETVTLATDSPEKLDRKAISAFFPGKHVTFAFTLPEYINESFSLYEQPLATRFTRIISAGARVAPEIVDEIVKDALAFRASDIHFEPRAKETLVRFRVDGNLRDAGSIPSGYYENILNRIKVESGMRIDEHLTAQDGALQRQIGSYRTDMRVSLVPTVEGEKIVMRLLGSYIQEYTLTDIGLNAQHQAMLEAYAAKPFGMLLAVGPTGSGKTTTLYSLVKMLNKHDVNITSIEDPVEYKIAGVNQIQVREQTGMTFARGLRSIVRQDPNIILVGEIRDQETAEISVNAALTGHLLLSTFHANDAATAIPRLRDMGIEPFLLASTVEIIVAQRLVRRICLKCRYSIPVIDVLRDFRTNAVPLARYFSKTDHVYAGKGCAVCNGTGYAGRTALFEFIEITPEMQDLIVKNPTARDIQELAVKQGSRTMFEDGIAKIKGGITTLSEVTRVVEPPRSRN